jgi:hypothetical protein
MIEIYESQKKKVFAAFIDLRKAFDTVWHKGLFYVLLKHNFPHKIFKMIHSIFAFSRSSTMLLIYRLNNMGLKTSPCFTPHVETKSLLIKVSTDTSFELDFTMGVLIQMVKHT